MTTLLADSFDSVFDLVTGLPMHPLVAHFAVVLLPLGSIGLLIALFVPTFRTRFGILMVLAVIGGAGAAFVASQSGEQFAKRVGLPQEHASLGELLPLAAFGLAISAVAWFVLTSRPANAPAIPYQAVLTKLATTASFVLAVGAIVGTTLVGHSGATAVWKNRIDPQAQPSSSSTPTSDPYLLTMDEIGTHATKTDCWTVFDGKVYDLTPWLATHTTDTSVACGATSSGLTVPAGELLAFEIGTLDTASTGPGFTAAEVATHTTASDCWSIVNGRVYDLTKWIPLHPGGEAVIQAMCGKDSSAAFNGQHAGAQKPAEEIAQYEIGVLK